MFNLSIKHWSFYPCAYALRWLEAVTGTWVGLSGFYPSARLEYQLEALRIGAFITLIVIQCESCSEVGLKTSVVQ